MTIDAKDINMKVTTGGALIPPDNEPDAFALIDQTNVPTSTPIESAAITVEGMDTFGSAAISVDIGEYQVDSGAWVSAPGAVGGGASVKVRHTSSPDVRTDVNQLLTIGSASDTFTTTTDSGSLASLTTVTAGNWLVEPKYGWTRWQFDVDVDYAIDAGGYACVIMPVAGSFNITAIQWFDLYGIYGGGWRTQNNASGSMWNAIMDGDQGLSNAIALGGPGSTYDASENIALSLPFTINTAGTVLSHCEHDGSALQFSGAGARTGFIGALSVLDARPNVGFLRPPVTGTNKTVQHNVSDIDYTVFSNNPLLGTEPTQATVLSRVDNIYLVLHTNGANSVIADREIQSHWIAEDYGGYRTYDAAQAMGWLQMDYTDAEKEPIALALIYQGMDIYASLSGGGGTRTPNGGSSSSYLALVLLAGRLLNDSNMLNLVGCDAIEWQETHGNHVVQPGDIGVGRRVAYANGLYTGTVDQAGGATTLHDADAGFAFGSTGSVITGNEIVRNVTKGEQADFRDFIDSGELLLNPLSGGAIWEVGDSYSIDDEGKVDWQHTANDKNTYAGRQWIDTGDPLNIENYRLGENQGLIGIAWACDEMGLLQYWPSPVGGVTGEQFYRYHETLLYKTNDAAYGVVDTWITSACNTYMDWRYHPAP